MGIYNNFKVSGIYIPDIGEYVKPSVYIFVQNDPLDSKLVIKLRLNRAVYWQLAEARTFKLGAAYLHISMSDGSVRVIDEMPIS